MSQARTALPGSDRHELRPHVPHPACHPDERHEVTLVTIGHLTDDEASLLQSFADQHGLVVVAYDSTRRRMVLSGRTPGLESAFGVELHHREHDAGTYCCHYGPLTVPTNVAHLVEGVFGLDNRPAAKPHFRKMAAKTREHAATRAHTAVWKEAFAKNLQEYTPAVDKATEVMANEAYAAAFKKPPGTFLPTDLAKLYNFPAGDGAGQCIGIIELGGGYKVPDFQKYQQETGGPPLTVSAVSVDHARNQTGSDADGEVMLDIEVAGAIAPKAKIAVYFCPNTDQGFLDGITTAIHDQHNKPSVISISWGGPESSYSKAAMTSMNKALQEASAAGITVLVASGDDGSSDGVDDGNNHVDFPASSPYVCACGGTKLVANLDNPPKWEYGIVSEVIWNETAKGEGAGGGGVSAQFAVPDWQQGIPAGIGGRGVPDVSANADPETGYCVRVEGQDQVIGGTSAVAPLYAGLVARLNQIKGKRVGFLNPKLYSSAGVCRDITSGSNGAFSATVGYDFASGLGVIDGAKLLEAI